MSKPVMSLKQFMLRAEILKLYRGFLRLGKLLDEPPPAGPSSTGTGSASNSSNSSDSSSQPVSPGPNSSKNTANPMRAEWTNWVRSEFRLRQASTTDEEMAKALLGYGKRQLQEMERSIMLATNRNKPPEVEKPKPVRRDKSKNRKNNAGANCSSQSDKKSETGPPD